MIKIKLEITENGETTVREYEFEHLQYSEFQGFDRYPGMIQKNGHRLLEISAWTGAEDKEELKLDPHIETLDSGLKVLR